MPASSPPFTAMPGRLCTTRAWPRLSIWRTFAGRWLAAAGVLTLGACSPELDWRDVAGAESGVTVQMPCKPKRQARQLAVAGHVTSVTLAACQAQGMTFALSWTDVGDPVRVGPALVEWREAAQANLRAQLQPVSGRAVAGATPNDQAGRWALVGQSPQGETRRSEVVLASRGTWVVQATVLAAAWDAQAADTFLSSLRFQVSGS